MSLEYNKKMIPRAKELRRPMTKSVRGFLKPQDFISSAFPMQQLIMISRAYAQ